MWQSCPSSPEAAGTAPKAGPSCLPWAKHWNQSPRGTVTSHKLCLGIWQEDNASEMMMPCRTHSQEELSARGAAHRSTPAQTWSTALVKGQNCWTDIGADTATEESLNGLKPSSWIFILLPRLLVPPRGALPGTHHTVCQKILFICGFMGGKPKLSGIPARLCKPPLIPILSTAWAVPCPVHLHWAHQGL